MLFYFACEAAGASRARHSLRPLMFQMAGRTAKLGHAPRERGGVCLKHAAPLNLAPLAGRGPRRSAATYRGEGDYPQVRACLRLPLTRSQDARDLSPQPGRGEERSPCKQWIAFEIKSEIQRRRPGQASESKRDPGPTRERNALIATPRLLVGHQWPIRFTTTNIGGYGALLSQGRRTVRGEIAQVCVISRRIAVTVVGCLT